MWDKLAGDQARAPPPGSHLPERMEGQWRAFLASGKRFSGGSGLGAVGAAMLKLRGLAYEGLSQAHRHPDEVPKTLCSALEEKVTNLAADSQWRGTSVTGDLVHSTSSYEPCQDVRLRRGETEQGSQARHGFGVGLSRRSYRHKGERLIRQVRWPEMLRPVRQARHEYHQPRAMGTADQQRAADPAVRCIGDQGA